jgi:branched-chain amino acid transport system permease protein
MVYILQQTINGLLLGLIYALMASGLTLEFGVLKVANFGYGALYLIGGYATFTFAESLGLNFWIALVISFVLLFVAGMIVERFGFARFRNKEMATFVFGVGLMIAVRAGAMLVWGSQGHGINPPLSQTFHLGDFIFSGPRLLAAIVSLGAIIALTLVLRKTTLGKIMRCVSDSKIRAEILGIDTSRIYMITMGIGTAVSAVAASILATIFVVGPEVDMTVLFKGFIIIILAGMGSVGGAIVGGLIIALVEVYTTAAIGVVGGIVASFGILVIILLVKPEGLFGAKVRQI